MNHSSFRKTAAKTTAALLGVFMLFAGETKANYVQISGVSVSGTAISFNISWQNSWNVPVTPGNRDAVWLFVKYKECTNNIWYHANLLGAGHYPLAADNQLLQLDLAADSKGAFIRRRVSDITAVGDIAAQPCTLNLNIAAGSYDFKVFGIEMVRVLNENFQVGDGAAANGYNGTVTTITSEGALTAAQIGGTGAVALPAAYPKGWNAFYAMKYEISQEEYVDFLNCLTYDQQYTRTNGVSYPPSAPAGTRIFIGGVDPAYRNGIVIVTPGVSNTQPAVYGCNNNGTAGGAAAPYNAADDGQNIACNYLSWADLTAYLDWACLRPMTELEYEKICRGPVTRLAGEYPWGGLIITWARSYTASACPAGWCTNPGQATEVALVTGSGLCAYWACGAVHTWASGPMRCGFAATSTTDRVTAGATRYGSLDMAGNLWEQCVNTSDAGASAFTNTLGDGALAANGDQNVGATWTLSITGVAIRGGAWNDAAARCQTSDRTYYANGLGATTTRYNTVGGRGVRQD